MSSFQLEQEVILLSRNDEIEVIIGPSRTPNEENRKIAFDGDGIFNIVQKIESEYMKQLKPQR